MNEDTSSFHQAEECHTSTIGPFICGTCGATLDSICILHIHMTDQHSDGSYHYDNLIKTAFPKYDSFCVGTQTCKMDKRYLRQYRRSQTGNSPIYVNKMKVETEVRDNVVFMKSDTPVTEDDIPVMKPTKPSKSKAQKRNISTNRYKFRTSTKLNRQQLQTCAVLLDRLDVNYDRKELQKGEGAYQHKMKGVDDNSCDNLSTNAHLHAHIKVEAPDNNMDTSSADQRLHMVDDMLEDNDDNWEDIHAFTDETLPDYSLSDTNVITFTETVLSLNKPPINRSKTGMHVQSDTADIGIKKEPATSTVTKRKYIRRKKALNSDLDLDMSVLVNTKRSRKHIFESFCVLDSESDDAAIKGSKAKHNVKGKREKKTQMKPLKTELKPTEKSTVKKKYRYTFICHLCGQELPRRSKELHMNKHMGLKPYVCDECGKTFALKLHLKSHKRFHARDKGIGQFTCTVCGQIYVTKDTYMVHVNNHTGAKPCKCSQCDAAFSIPKQLKEHVRRVHQKLKTKKCDRCGNLFFNKAALVKHISVHHAEPTRPCKYCGKLFRDNQVRHNHELTHTGQKDFYCCVCHYGFIQWWPCLGHMMKQHGFSKEQVVDMKMKLKLKQKQETLQATVRTVAPIRAAEPTTRRTVDTIAEDHSIDAC